MKIVKLLTPSEINLTEDEERYLCELCSGSADSCYVMYEVTENIFDNLNTEDKYDRIEISAISKMIAHNDVEMGDTVMINLCW